MWVLMGMSVMALGVYLERYFHYYRSTVLVPEFMEGLASLVHARNHVEAAHQCADTPGPVSRVVHSALLRHNAPRAELKDIVTEAAQLEVPRLERHLRILGAIGYLAPLIGLLGTVVGLAETFQAFSSASGVATASDIGQGVHRSLFTAAAGLIVAIEVYVFHSHLLSRLHALLHDMERAGIEMLNLLIDEREDRHIIHLPVSGRGASVPPGNVVPGRFEIVS